MNIITQTLFTTFLDFCLTHWRLETMIIITTLIIIWLTRKYHFKFTKTEIVLSIFCIFLFYCNAYFIDFIITQQQLINKQKETINLYRDNMERFSKNLDNELIRLEFATQIKELEKRLQEKH